MNKKLLAAAIGAALVAGPMLAAHADVKVYGQAQVEAGSRDIEWDRSSLTALGAGNPVTTPAFAEFLTEEETDNMVMEDNARGRLGVYATEDLGGGLTGLARFEWRVDTADNVRGLTGRESWGGLKGGFGTLQVGNLRSAYKYTGGGNYDPFVTTMMEARGRGGMTGNELQVFGSEGAFGHNNFLSNSVGWMSPNWQGLKVWATYSPDEEGDTRGSDGDYSAAVLYGTKQWEVFVAAVADDTAGDKDDLGFAVGPPFGVQIKNKREYDSTKVGGKLNLGQAGQLAFQYEMGEASHIDINLEPLVGDLLGADPDYRKTTTDVTTYFIGYQLPFGGKWTAAVNYGAEEWDISTSAECNAITDSALCGATVDTDYLAAGLIYKFSKQTRVFGGISNSEVDGLREEDVISIGLRKDF